MKQWYALHSKPRRELSAAMLLQEAGIEVYAPQISVQKRLDKSFTTEPLFPGYIFGRLNPQVGEIRLVEYTRGILYVVGYGGKPCPVPDNLIISIKESLNRRCEQEITPDYHPGDRLIITTGPMQDVAAIFDCHLSASGRVRILIQVLQRLYRVEVNIKQLRRANPAEGTA